MIPKDPKAGRLGREIREGEWEARRIRYFAGQVIVQFKAPPANSDRTSRSMSDAIAHELPGGRVKRYPGPTGRTVITFDHNESVFDVVRRLSRREDIGYVEPDVVDTAQLVPNDTRYGEQWSHQTIGSEGAWDLQTGAASVLIGIIDSGISTTAGGALDHPDLDTPGRFVLGTDFVDGGAPRDLNGHGTHVTGIAAAESNNNQGVAGMNWASPVYVCRTLDTSGNGSSADFADAVEEIVDYAVAHSLHAVINYSAGGAANLTKQNACQYAQTRGMILCAATGNDNGGPVIFPAAYSTTIDNVVAVGSTDDNDTVSSFSNVGPEVTVVAPGRSILSTMPTYAVNLPVALNYDYLDGTSMATPLVTGLVALMWSRHPSSTYTTIRNCLINTAVKLGPGVFNNSWGNGRIAAEAALRCGDFVFPSLFTLFTRFTRFTLITPFSPFTRFTVFTLFTRFTRWTRFTYFSLFTRFTPFTRFSPFTRFQGVSSFLGRFRQPLRGERFVRIGKTVFELSEVDIHRFQELKASARDLRRVNIQYLHELASSDRGKLAAALKYRPEEADALVKLAKQLLSRMSKP